MSVNSTIEHSLQRKYTLIHGQCKDHAGNVDVSPIPNFDLDTTIFTTLKGTIPRLFMKAKIAKRSIWKPTIEQKINADYLHMRSDFVIPPIDDELLQFMEKECDFNAEHADGSFMEHLLYGYEYALRFYPEHSARVMLLHSIMGTATNTFAMQKTKIPILKSLLTDFEFTHIAAFPSFLRLMYEPSFFSTLLEHKSQIHTCKEIRFHRVIDNESMQISIKNLWIQLNYHLIHLVDFLPVANWQTHKSDPLMQMLIQLSDLLDAMNQKQAQVVFPKPTKTSAQPIQETLSLTSKVSNWIPASSKMKMATKSIRSFSKQIGHSLDFELIW